jgi:hypothetical protein
VLWNVIYGEQHIQWNLKFSFSFQKYTPYILEQVHWTLRCAKHTGQIRMCMYILYSMKTWKKLSKVLCKRIIHAKVLFMQLFFLITWGRNVDYLCNIVMFTLICPDTVLEMKILIYWSESNSLIYFYIVLNKNWKNLMVQQMLLLLGWRTGAHRENCW